MILHQIVLIINQIHLNMKYSSWPDMHACPPEIFPKCFLCCKLEDSIPDGNLETELDATGEYFSMFNHP